jgi:molecular chaperone GrpE
VATARPPPTTRWGTHPGDARTPRTETPVDERTEPAADDSVAFKSTDAVTGVAADDTVEHDIDVLLSAARHERDEYREMAQRVQADFENYKKRMLRQQTDHLERAAEDLVTKILPVLDAFDLARAHLGDGEDVSAEGKALVAGSTLLADTLAREGLERIEDAGAPFDPTTHEAVDHVPDAAPTASTTGTAGTPGATAGAASAGQDARPGHATPDGPVVDEVLRAGYRWKGRVIRPAMVRVRG